MRMQSHRRHSANLLTIILAVVFLSQAALLSAAENDTSAVPGLSGDSPIQVTADEMVAENQSRTVEFIGNVEAIQGEVIIHANRLKIRYSESGDAAAGGGLEGKVETITAAGAVNIRFGNRTATAEKAEYRTAEGVLVLSGKSARVVDGENSITGSRITLYRQDDRITVEGGEKQRVKAVFFPSSEGSN